MTTDDINTDVPDDTGNSREENIRRRAHEISQSENAGTPEENWYRAEHELYPHS